MQIIITVTNQGRTPSTETTISLYDNPSIFPPYQGGTQGGVIDTKPVRALNSEESQEITFIWNVLGKAGEHTIKAITDPENIVIEFNEENNTSQMNILIPDIVLITETDKNIYKIRQKVNINSIITNLTPSKTYSNLILITSISSPTGEEAYQNSTPLTAIQPSVTTAHSAIWNTAGLTAEGIYTITQKVISDSQLITQNSKLITLEKAPDFILNTDTDYRKIKQGEGATYTAYLKPVNGWTSDVTLNIGGLPSGTSVLFNPDNLTSSGEAIITVITTDSTTIGTHVLNLSAEGIDEGEIVTHTLPLTLDISGFRLIAEPSNQTIKQLNAAIFDININSINGYEGKVNLSIDNVPYGTKIFFDITNTIVPGNVKLTILTSKYVRPGNYTFTIAGDDRLVKHMLNLNLNLLPNPEIRAGIITAEGPGPNNEAWIRLFNIDPETSSGQPVLDLTAFDTKYGAYVTSADIDGDGYDEIIVSQGAAPKNKAILRVFKQDGTLIAEHTAFDTKYGLTFSTGDLDGDWEDELIVGMGPDPKNPATLKVLKYNGNGFTEEMTYTAFDTRYGLNTAVGDIDGDGTPEIITAPGPGPNNPAIIKMWRQSDSGGEQNLTELYSFEAFEGNYGANIATGDIDGDGKAEIITGTGPDPKNPAIVRVYKADGTLIREFTPYDVEYGYGVEVAAVDINGDGIDEIVTGLGPGPQNPSWVKVFNSDGSEIYSFISYPDDIEYGVRVSKGNMGTE
ncbi:MAG: VCBS repeat-containing protein [Nitrospirae bacterium]|nr:VCBS repeat-containing protein [Nitrospirota bacterium]